MAGFGFWGLKFGTNGNIYKKISIQVNFFHLKNFVEIWNFLAIRFVRFVLVGLVNYFLNTNSARELPGKLALYPNILMIF